MRKFRLTKWGQLVHESPLFDAPKRSLATDASGLSAAGQEASVPVPKRFGDDVGVVPKKVGKGYERIYFR